MLTIYIGAIAAFISTNIDDLLLLMLLYAQTNSASERRQVTLGQILGIALLTAVSACAGLGLGQIDGHYLRLLGIVPILLAIRLLLRRQTQISAGGLGVLSVTMVTLANGGDNLGVYIPLFSTASLPQLVLCGGLFLLLTLLWCRLGLRLSTLPQWGERLQQHQRWLVPAVFFLLGLGILLGI